MCSFVVQAIKLLAIVLACYCVMELFHMTPVDASQKEYRCFFGAGKYENYAIMAAGAKEAEHKFGDRFKEIKGSFFPIKCYITK